ncbi:MAG: manganese-binding transcriptional regulator MntR, partial [Phycisphaerae bacterium]|nr:manganese-binding transcriptional regulator MntR [Phycisphaerae bacterium]
SRKATSSRKAATSRTAAPTRKPAQARAGFQRTRAARANEVAQDYAEAIAELRDAVGVARVVDLARLLGVSHVTVVRTVARLRRAGIVDRERVAGLRLTPAGQRIARDARKRHEAVTEFLRALGVPPAVAEVDAEGIEHHVSAETLAAFRRFTRRTAKAPSSQA